MKKYMLIIIPVLLTFGINSFPIISFGGRSGVTSYVPVRLPVRTHKKYQFLAHAIIEHPEEIDADFLKKILDKIKKSEKDFLFEDMDN